jgi:putative ABC transport system substrate-binding protein
MKIKTIIRIIAGILIITAIFSIFFFPKKNISGIVKVGIIEPLNHIAVSDITKGIKDSLSNSTLKFQVIVKNASNDISLIPQILDDFKSQGIDIYVPIFSKTAQITKNSIHDKPIIFAAVTDPVAAGVLKSPDSSSENITGVSDLWPISNEFALIKEILPNARVVGIVFDPSDVSSSVTIPLIQKEVKERGLELILRPIHSTNEMAQSLSSLPTNIDLLFTANDVTVTAAFPALVGFSIRKHIPLFAGDYSSVERGAIAAVGQNYYIVGTEVADIIKTIRNGESINKIPVRYTKGGDVFLNIKAAELMGVKLPQSVVNNAKNIYKEINNGGK